MNVLLTGASGFLGRNLLLHLPDTWKVTALYRADASFPEFVRSLRNPDVVAVRCDLSSATETGSFFDSCGRDWDCCIYLAARVDIPWSVREPQQDLFVNTGSLLNVLQTIRCDRFLYFSSGAVYDGLGGEVQPGMPLSPTLPYAISKLASEQYVRCFHERRRSIDRYLVVRFFGAYGPYEAPHKIYTRLARAFAVEGQKSYTIYGSGRNLIDAMYVDDAVEAVLRMAAGQHWNDTVDLCSGRPMTIESLVREVATALGVPNVEVRKEGIAHEDIQFQASGSAVQTWWNFSPAIPLSVGMPILSDFLRASNATSELSIARGS